METIVVAMGGNALARHDEHGTYAEQKANAGQLASVVRWLLRDGYRVLVTHGNGPQVGNLAIQQEEGSQLVPPEPREIIEAAAIRLLVEAGFVVVACGGGGIPVTRAGHGLHGAEAVIDKDLSAALLASAVGASALMMLTDVDRVMLDFGSPTQR